MKVKGKMRGTVLVVTLVLVLTLLVACGGQAPAAAPAKSQPAPTVQARPAAQPAAQPTAQPAAQPAAQSQPAKQESAGPVVQMAMSLGGATGSYYLQGTALAEFLNKNSTKIRTVPSISGGGVENIRRVAQGEMPLGQVMASDLPDAWEGKDVFKAPLKDLRIIGPGGISPVVIQIVVLAKSGITSLDGLKGKTFVPGAPGSTTTVVTDKLLKELGIYGDMTVQYLPQAEFPNLLKNNVIQGFSRGANFPAAFVEEINATHPVRVLDLGSDLVKTNFVTKYPTYGKMTIPAGTYKGQDKDVTSLSLESFWATNKAVSDDAVYEFTRLSYSKEAIAHLDKNYPQHSHGLADPLAGLPAPLHPGAEKFWKERGVKIPAPILKP